MLISLAALITAVLRPSLAALINILSPVSYASRSLEYTSAGNLESIGRYTKSFPSPGNFTANSTRSVVPVTATFSSYCSGERICSRIAPSCISPRMPLVFTFDRTFFKSPTPAARLCISPRLLVTCSSVSVNCLFSSINLLLCTSELSLWF